MNRELFQRINAFYEQEVKISGGHQDRLSAPEGPEDSNLGITLHLKTEEGEISSSWDPKSPTIELLSKKGMNRDNTFGFD
ncbi:hypothetical protein F4801DRAFT_531872 [Xylaria longipes]|nr:hypothetical protein F4801DRAFT_531872 [Xylaria longipes]